MEVFRSLACIMLISMLLLPSCSAPESFGAESREYENAGGGAYSHYPDVEEANQGLKDIYLDVAEDARAEGLRERVVTKDELVRLTEVDPALSYSVAKQILARLNGKAAYYIAQDIKNGHPLKVPDDFKLFKNWTPLPRYIPEMSGVAKFILIVKDIPFIGWYEYGRLVGDSNICIGKSEGWTQAGVYKVRDKDIDHVSGSYSNAYGEPAPMPWALRIYGHVWIHAGDITDGYCSHGCINLPLMPAQKLYGWADYETAVMIVETLPGLQIVLQKNRSNCTLFAHACRQTEAGPG